MRSFTKKYEGWGGSGLFFLDAPGEEKGFASAGAPAVRHIEEGRLQPFL